LAATTPVDSSAPNPYEAAPRQETHLWDYVHVLLRRRKLLIAIFAIVVATAALRSFLTRPVYEANAQLLIERTNPTVVDFKGVTQDQSYGYGIDDYYQTQYRLLQSRSLAHRVVERLNLLNDPAFGGPRSKEEIDAIQSQPTGQSPIMEAAIGGVLGGLAIRPVKNSRLVVVSVTSGDPAMAARLANGVAKTYIEQSLDFRYQTSSEAGTWLGGQIAEQRKRVQQLDEQLQALKSREGVVNIEERRTLLDQKLKELGSALNERKTERLQKEALWRQMANASNPEELPDVMRSPLVQSLRLEQANLERQQAQLLERYLEQHPEVLKVKNQLEEVRRKVRAESQRVIRSAENDYKAAAAQEASVNSALESAKQEALDLGKRGVSYDSQKRELDAAQQVLNSLMSREKETDVTAEIKSSNIRVVDEATVPKGPIRPRRMRDILMGILLGAFLSLGAVFFVEYLDNTLKTPDDVRNHLGAPLLGVIPELKGTDETERVVATAKGDGPFVEGYRVVRTALSYCWPESGSHILLVTSTSPGEGKTVTAVNVAMTLASGGSRVLLIDADLRKPQTHVLTRMRRTPGLSDVIVGKAKPSEAIQRTVPGTRLSYLPSGTTVPSPADLLSNRTMSGLLDGLRKFYDWIVIDSPPVGAVAEPLILAPLVDGVIVVAGAEMVPRKAVIHSLERIGETGARILGVVLNRAQIEKHSYYYSHYYGHYYGSYYGRGPRPVEPRLAAVEGGHSARRA
jgi:capsular exopolysaccharide synthesis family protein